MFSDDSQNNLLKIIESSIRDNLKADSLVFGNCDDKEISEKENIIVLTLSSHTFRLILFWHFNFDSPTNDYIRSQLNKDEKQLSDKEIEKQNMDFISELSNAYCGQLKRVLGHQFLHLGMSTPNPLNKDNFIFIDELECNFKNTRRIRINSNVNFYLSYCLCFQDNTDFIINPPKEDESESGELEFF
ncbi:MAG: hypothetical protein OQL19_04995 [Gammaproteobacteria bacterium]|nr:hypothetical protein [Gammaproteobacteria bacterium]